VVASSVSRPAGGWLSTVANTVLGHASVLPKRLEEKEIINFLIWRVC
jgi:hypothetical protein